MSAIPVRVFTMHPLFWRFETLIPLSTTPFFFLSFSFFHRGAQGFQDTWFFFWFFFLVLGKPALLAGSLFASLFFTPFQPPFDFCCCCNPSIVDDILCRCRCDATRANYRSRNHSLVRRFFCSTPVS